MDDGRYIIVFLEDGTSANKLELTWPRSQEKPYDLGDERFHIAFKTDGFDAASWRDTRNRRRR